jgi:hypothetical protein
MSIISFVIYVQVYLTSNIFSLTRLPNDIQHIMSNCTTMTRRIYRIYGLKFVTKLWNRFL